MNHFKLFAHGEFFDPEAFLASTTLQFDHVWHKGDQGHDHPKSNGVGISLGDGRAMSWPDQVRLAIEFLAANENELRLLARFSGVTTFILGLQRHITLDGFVIGTAVGVPSELMKWALEIGIEPTVYVSLDYQQNTIVV